MAFQELLSEMEDHNSDLNSQILHKNGDSSIFNPHHSTANSIEKQRFVRTMKDMLMKADHNGLDSGTTMLQIYTNQFYTVIASRINEL